MAGLVSAMVVWSAGINYDGTNLELNNEFTRTECGTAYKKVIKEVSGLACSRQTPGYLWAHGDEDVDDNRKIVAISPAGDLAMTVMINTKGSDRDDWEDIATGVYDGKNYVFIGAIGDNDCAYKDQYYIYYFEEPAITSGTITVEAQAIRFGYPDGKAYNTETLLYDNLEQVFYIANKVEDSVCSLYSLPFRTDYGSGLQQLTLVCALGNGENFHTLTGGDITPDGQWMAIKNEKYLLLWARQDNESLSVTAKRKPVQVAAYKKEAQGESIAWLDANTFYTTSDQKKDTPIYKYARTGSTPPDDPDPEPTPVDSTLKAVNEVILSNHYSAYINEGETVIRGWYLAGTEKPDVQSYQLSEGATWTQEGDEVTITALDGSKAFYTLDIQPVMPVAFTSEELVFDGSDDEAAWLKSAYGWADDKKWKFSKTDDDFSREIAGKTHIELFLPACDTVMLKSMSKERDVRFYVNGVQFGEKVKLAVAGNALAVRQGAPFMLTVASAQSSGDGGIAAIRMARAETTDIESIPHSDVSIQKVLSEGTLYILVGDKLYDITGKQIR